MINVSRFVFINDIYFKMWYLTDDRNRIQGQEFVQFFFRHVQRSKKNHSEMRE